MSNANYEIRQSGIKAFPEGNRIDFIFEEPGEDVTRASVFYDNMDANVKLAGSKLTILPPDRNEDGSLKNPKRLSIRWGRRIINLGLCEKPGIKPYFYRGLSTANDAQRPKTVDDLFAAMGFGE